VKRIAVLILLMAPACHRKAAAPGPTTAVAPVEETPAPPLARREVESAGTLILPPPKPKGIRPPPVEERAPAPKRVAESPAGAAEAPTVEGSRLPMWKQRAKFY
jgi:hypothetical protein